MEKVPSQRRRDKHADSLEDSASASGRILSYQRLHSDTSPKAAAKTGICAESTRVPIYSSRARQRNRADSQHQHSTPRSAHSNAGCNTIRPRLSSTSLHQIHHEHNQHPNCLDHCGKCQANYSTLGGRTATVGMLSAVLQKNSKRHASAACWRVLHVHELPPQRNCMPTC